MATARSVLARAPFFQLLGERERNALAPGLQPVRYPAGQLLFHYGDPGDSMYIVLSGRVQAFIEDQTGRKIVLGTVGPAEVFGEISLIDGGPRTASIEVIDDMEALRLGREELRHFLSRRPAVAMALLSVMGRHLRQNSEHLRRTAPRNANRVAAQDTSVVHRIADLITAFSGSIPFLFLHIAVFALWFLINTRLVPGPQFDPYPFLFLSLGVSLEMVILSVFVLLSQKRERQKSSIRDDVEYEVNLKAELEIAHLHEKIERLNSRFLEQIGAIEQAAGVAR